MTVQARIPTPESREGNRLAKRRQRSTEEYRELERVRRREVYKEKEAAATWRRKSNPEGWVINVIPRLRFRAKKFGLACTVTAADIKVPDRCPVFGTPFTFERGRAGRTLGTNPSVDRFRNDLGYIPGNVRVISLRANFLKKDATLDDVRRLLRYMEGGDNQ